MEFRVLAPLGSRVGESPVWDDRRGALFVCDILAPAIHLVTLDGAVQATWRFDRPVGSIGLTESGRLIVALGRDLAVFDPDTGSLRPLRAYRNRNQPPQRRQGRAGWLLLRRQHG